jgi:hypothetical protein
MLSLPANLKATAWLLRSVLHLRLHGVQFLTSQHPNHPKHSITDHSEIQIQIMTNMPNSYEQVELLRKSIEDAKRLKAELEQSMAEIEKPVLEMKATAHNRATAHKKAKIKKSN